MKFTEFSLILMYVGIMVFIDKAMLGLNTSPLIFSMLAIIDYRLFKLGRKGEANESTKQTSTNEKSNRS